MLGNLHQNGATCVGLKAAELKPRFPVRIAARRVTPNLKVKAVAEPPTLPQEAERTQWRPESWRQFKAHQQPKYPDAQALHGAVEEITNLPPLVFAGECRNLQAKLARCAAGEAFLLQGS
jgi:Class-II DAHP synthetase family